MHKLRPTRAEIDLEALGHNLNVVKDKVGKERKILGVVKANAYGHGAVTIAKELLRQGAYMLGVAIVEEAIELRKAGIDCPILILAGLLEVQIDDIIEYNLIQTIYTYPVACALSDIAVKKNKQVKVHIKVDTGMGRLGILPSQVIQFITKIQSLPNITIDGIFTHLAVADRADEENKAYTEHQIKIIQKVFADIEQNDIHIPLRHVANSAAIITRPEVYFDMVRPGIMLYGAYPSKHLAKKVSLKPVMSLKTRIVFLKTAPAGTSISYGRTFITKRESKIATILIGYDDGYNRLLSNNTEVLINGKKAPVVGTICMDMCMVDVTDIENVNIGDEVILFGKDNAHEITADDLAERLKTISYEIFCRIGRRVPRVYKKNNETVSVVDNLVS